MRAVMMARESLDAPENLPKQPLRQVAFGQPSRDISLPSPVMSDIRARTSLPAASRLVHAPQVERIGQCLEQAEEARAHGVVVLAGRLPSLVEHREDVGRQARM